MLNLQDTTNDETSFDYKIYKKLFHVPAIFSGKEVLIKKCQFFTELNIQRCCEVKIDGKWYATTREQVLAGLRAYNQQKRMVQIN